jgi:hypothetical protein
MCKLRVKDYPSYEKPNSEFYRLTLPDYFGNNNSISGNLVHARKVVFKCPALLVHAT